MGSFKRRQTQIRNQLLGAAVILSTCLIAHSFASSQRLLPDLDLFQVDVAVHTNGVVERLIAKTSERYPLSQSRAKIGFQLFKPYKLINEDFPHRHGLFYVDRENKITLLRNTKKEECVLTNEEQLLQSLHLDDIPLPIGYPHVVGLARVLVYVMQNKKHLQFRGDVTYKQRNAPLYYFYKDYEVAPGRQGNLVVFFSKKDIEHEFPVRVVVSQPGARAPVFVDQTASKFDEQSFIIDFSSIRPVKPILDAGNSIGRSVVFDSLALSPLTGCTKLLDSSQTSANLFGENIGFKKRKFSFRGKMEIMSAKSKRISNIPLFVAYDDTLKALRVDSGKILHKQRDTSKLTQIFNLITQKRYSLLSNLNDQKLESFGSTKCAISKIEESAQMSLMGNTKNILIGHGEFVQLGRAKVRGIESLVYEAISSDAPIWLERTIKKDKNNSTLNSQDEEDKFVVIAYIATRENSDSDGNQLLRLEFHRMDSKLRTLIERRIIRIYDFSWDLLNGQAPNGDFAEEFFSLSDKCPTETTTATTNDLSISHQNQVKVELLVEKPADVVISSIELKTLEHETRKRNFMVLAALQRWFNFYPNLVFDLRTQILNVERTPEKGEKVFMSIMFHLITYSQESVDALDYVGKGNYLEASGGSDENQREDECPTTTSFEYCQLLVAHRRQETYFSFDTLTGLCCFAFEANARVEKTPDALFQPIYELTKSGQLDVFRIRRSVDRLLRPTQYLAALERGEDSNKKLELTGANNLEYAFQIRRVKVERQTSLSVSSEIDLSETELTNSIGKISGYSFSDSETSCTHLFEMPSPVSSIALPDFVKTKNNKPEQNKELSFESCKSICNSDLQCKSFSVCTRDGRITCKLSKIDFTSIDLVKELLLAGKQLRQGKEFELQVHLDDKDEQQINSVKLVKRANCAIHNKDMLDYFRFHGHRDGSWSQSAIMPVQNVGECARFCATRNIKLFRNPTEEEQSEALSLEKRKFDNTKGPIYAHCDSFGYVSSQSLFEQLDGLRKWLPQFEGDSKKVLGYCFFEGRDAFFNYNNSKEKFGLPKWEPKVRIVLQSYSFDESKLYDVIPGISLKPAPLSKEERDAYNIIMNQLYVEGDILQESRSILTRMLERGDNFQFSDKERSAIGCANLCLIHESQVWSGCKSFEVITSGGHTTCKLNSISLQQAIRSNRTDLIAAQTGEDWQVLHYEPHPGYLLELLLEQQKRDSNLFDLLLSEEGIGRNSFVQTGGILLVILFGCLVGTLIGIVLAERVLLNRVDSVDRRFSVSRVNITEMNDDEDL